MASPKDETQAASTPPADSIVAAAVAEAVARVEARQDQIVQAAVAQAVKQTIEALKKSPADEVADYDPSDDDEDAGLSGVQVEVRILKAGHRKVATGEIGDARNPFPHYRHGDTPTLPVEIARELEARHYVEIQGELAE